MHVSAYILELGSKSKKRREPKNITALNLSFKIFKLGFQANDLSERSATLCVPRGTEYQMKSQGTCSQIFVSFGTL